MVTRRTLVAVAVVALVVLAGCSGAGGGGSGGGDTGFDEQERADGAATAAGGGGDGGNADDSGSAGEEATPAAQSAESRTGTVQAGRALIRTGSVRLEVDDYETTRASLASMARNHGGFVAESSETQHRRGNDTWTTGRLVIRVPSESFGPAFDTVKASGEVQAAESQTTDVTDQLVDLNARLSNLRVQRERLRTLYDEANDTEDVLRVGERLSEVQERIERLEAQKQSLQDRVAYSTITIEIREPTPPRDTPTPTPTPTPKPQYHETSLYQAFSASIGGVVVATKTAAVTLAYALPYLVVFGVPLGLGGAVLYGRRRR